ncbi:MAG: TadE family protein [Verrucomicrobiota bacterium]
MNLAHSRRSKLGQSFIELGMLIFVLVTIVFVILELGQYLALQLRMSSAAREAGRLALSNAILPKDGVNIDVSQTRSDFEDFVYDAIKDMISPSDLDKDEGRVFVTILKRSDDGSSTASSAVKITAEYVFAYGTTTQFNSAPSSMYAQGFEFNGDYADKIMDPLALDVGERTVLVEIYHPLTFTDLVRGLLNITSGWDSIYEYSVF